MATIYRIGPLRSRSWLQWRLSNPIKLTRSGLGVGAKELAAKSGCHKVELSRWESGERMPWRTNVKFIKLCRILKVDAEALREELILWWGRRPVVVLELED